MATQNNTQPTLIDFEIARTAYLATIVSEKPAGGAFLEFPGPDGAPRYLTAPVIEDALTDTEWQSLTGLDPAAVSA